jgi:hypothetical protein
MSEPLRLDVDRRELLRVLAIGTAAAATTAAPLTSAAADSETKDAGKRARYQPDSSEVQTFYRVNRYPMK